MISLLEQHTNGNRSVAIRTYGSTYHAESGVFDGVKWQWRRLGAYKAQKTASGRIQKEMHAISQGWTAQPTWTKEI